MRAGGGIARQARSTSGYRRSALCCAAFVPRIDSTNRHVHRQAPAHRLPRRRPFSGDSACAALCSRQVGGRTPAPKWAIRCPSELAVRAIAPTAACLPVGAERLLPLSCPVVGWQSRSSRLRQFAVRYAVRRHPHGCSLVGIGRIWRCRCRPQHVGIGRAPKRGPSKGAHRTVMLAGRIS